MFKSMTRRALLTIAATLMLTVSPPGLLAAATPLPNEFIRSLGNELLELLNNKALAPSQREEGFRRIFLKGVDVELIARFSLGQYWREASEAEKAEYRALFENWIVKSYAQRLADYSGENFSVKEIRPIADKENLVSTIINRANGPLRLDWRVRERDGRLWIIDVMVEGLSMAVTQRQEFSSFIANNGGRVSALNIMLRQRIASLNLPPGSTADNTKR